MELPKFQFSENEHLCFIAPAEFIRNGKPQEIRLLLTNQRLVLLTRENRRHAAAIAILTVIAVAIMLLLMLVPQLRGTYLLPVIAVIFIIAAAIHLHYRTGNPRLHRIIAEYSPQAANVAGELIILPDGDCIKTAEMYRNLLPRTPQD